MSLDLRIEPDGVARADEVRAGLLRWYENSPSLVRIVLSSTRPGCFQVRSAERVDWTGPESSLGDHRWDISAEERCDISGEVRAFLEQLGMEVQR
jgi:hypothetical protein